MSARFRKNAAWTAAAVAGMALAVPAQAVVVVDWNGGDHSSGEPLAREITWDRGHYGGDEGVLDSRGITPFSLEEAYNPDGDGYDATAGSAIFYGGSIWGFDDQNHEDVSIYRSYTTSFDGYVNLGHGGAVSASSFASHVLLWTQEGFLNGGDSQEVTLDETSSLSFTEGWGAHRSAVRFLVRVGEDQYYVSNTSRSSTSFTLSGQDLLDETWAAYDPTEGIVFDTGTPFDTSTSSLTNITGFGLYSYERSNPSNFFMGGFTVDAVIPEPASIGLMLGGAALMLLRRRSQEA